MARDLKPKCKYCRREGVKLFLKGTRCYSPKCAIVKRNFPPGMHGQEQKNQQRLSDYGTQLREKQKLKRMYGILENQLQIYFEKSLKHRGQTGDMLMKILECRLDNIVFRLGFVESRALARQLVNHGHFQVNGKTITIPSYQVKLNDVISLNKSSKDSPIFIGLDKKLNEKMSPEWLSVNPTEFTGKIIAMPDKYSMKQPFDIKIIIEYYSR